MPLRTLLLALLLLAGCSAPPPLALPPPPTGPAAPPLAVLGVEATYTPTRDRPRFATGAVTKSFAPLVCRECEEPLENHARDRPLPDCPDCEAKTQWVPRFLRPYQPPINGGKVAIEAARLLRARKGFADAVGPERAAPEGWRRLSVKLERAETTLIETNWLAPVKVVTLIVCSILIFPAVDPPNWLLPGEVYGITQEASWSVEAGGETLAKGRVKVTTVDRFAAFGFGATRPWFLIGFLRVPGCLDEEDWAVVSGQLEARAEVDLARAVVKAVEAKREALR